MNIDFQRYLDAKYYLDLRSLHTPTFDRLFPYMEKLEYPPKIIELGGGIGAMFTYLMEKDGKTEYIYTLIDAAKENIAFIPKNVKQRTEAMGFQFKVSGNQKYQVSKKESIYHLHTICINTEDYIYSYLEDPVFDIVVASSYLDIVPVPETLLLLDKITKKHACLYLPFNYDGLTFLHPIIDRHLDDQIISLYNLSMDRRQIGGSQTGGSLTGRKLLDWLPEAGYDIVSAGSSDWFLTPHHERYDGDESYFLKCILQFITDSVTPLWKDKPEILVKWLILRHQQLDEGRLSYLAHQMDYMALR